MDRQIQFPDIAERLNKVRIARALALLSPLQKHLFHLIPFLIHQNSVQYPGYHAANTPCGINEYQLSEIESQACDVFRYPLLLKKLTSTRLMAFMPWAVLAALAKIPRAMSMFG